MPMSEKLEMSGPSSTVPRDQGAVPTGFSMVIPLGSFCLKSNLILIAKVAPEKWQTILLFVLKILEIAATSRKCSQIRKNEPVLYTLNYIICIKLRKSKNAI